MEVILNLQVNYNDQAEMKLDEQASVVLYGFNRWFLNLPAENSEYIWGGGEQYSYFNLREGPTYPIWTREQGVGRNKSSTLTHGSVSGLRLASDKNTQSNR